MFLNTLLIFGLIATPYVWTQSQTATTTSKCGEGEFRCKSGACIALSSRCNGSIECPDRSDETFALCRKYACSESDFRCTYGGCVSSRATCDDKQDCADNSDELLPICRNDVDRNICRERVIEDRQLSRSVVCENSRDTCDNNEVLKEPTRCDGRVDCKDGSDETLATCADAICEPPLFRCAYGGCAYSNAQCDGVQNCADGSDESEELCDRILPAKTTSTTTTPRPVCIIPPQPDHGRYIIGDNVIKEPGEELPSFYLTISCDPGYQIVGSSSLFCINGWKNGEVPKCVRFCSLLKHDSVEYRCPIYKDGSVVGTRECEEFEPDDTVAEPRCRQPVYYYSGNLFYMRCIDGRWDNIVICTPECGKLGASADILVVDGRDAMRNELPWHVAIYTREPRTQICGGSVVSNNLIVTAAHCFWNDFSKLQPASNYLVAAGKLYREWGHPNDTDTQTSEIREIKIPARFQGAATNFQDDIALVILTTSLRYTVNVRPVCINFDNDFDARQLKRGSVGKVAGWGWTSRKSGFSDVLRVADARFVTIQECIADTTAEYKAYITSDKICAGYQNGTALCRGDSGGGLTFPERARGSYRWYLRGVASTAVNNDQLCDAATITSFTHIVTHAGFIQNYL